MDGKDLLKYISTHKKHQKKKNEQLRTFTKMF